MSASVKGIMYSRKYGGRLW